jgi:hypothetical protein
VNGTLNFNGTALGAGGALVNGSSRTFKNNIKDLSLEETQKVFNKLHPVKFTYKTSPDEKHVGFIAEDVPDLVATKDRKGLTALDIVAVLTKVAQEQEAKIKKLEQIVNKLLKNKQNIKLSSN